MNYKKAAAFFLDLLFPPRCVFCGDITAPGTCVCKKCAEETMPSGTVRCISLSVHGEEVPCAFLYAYRGKVRDSIIRYKFYGERRNAEFYAAELVRLVKKTLPAFCADLVTAVPLSKGRRKERGYNQSELLAKPIASALGLPFAQCLKKVKSNRVQHTLRREDRVKNVRGVYSLCGPDVEGRRILLIDDILTTGSTLAECSSVLLSGGAKNVACAVIARVPAEQVEMMNIR